MLTGQYTVTVDEKGRISIPSKFKAAVQGKKLVATRAICGDCIQVFFHEDFVKKAEAISRSSVAEFDEGTMMLTRYFVASADEVELDSTGRINISQSLKEWAGIKNKSDVVVIGNMSVIEIWNWEKWNGFINGARFNVASEAQKIFSNQ